ncbi:MAG: hypothetical protein K1W16_10320 [Lachnospiraceae bacterium]|jgi:hypothetical protein
MIHNVFGDIDFNVGWKTTKSIVLFGQSYVVTVKIHAYFEEDGITEEQENAYIDFISSEETKMNCVEKMLKEYSDFAQEQFIPRTLLMNRDGSYALLFDDRDNEDEGIAVCLDPEEKIVSQDDYL